MAKTFEESIWEPISRETRKCVAKVSGLGSKKKVEARCPFCKRHNETQVGARKTEEMVSRVFQRMRQHVRGCVRSSL